MEEDNSDDGGSNDLSAEDEVRMGNDEDVEQIDSDDDEEDIAQANINRNKLVSSDSFHKQVSIMDTEYPDMNKEPESIQIVKVGDNDYYGIEPGETVLKYKTS